MKNLSTATGIGADADFLNGNLVNQQTLLDTTILQDIVQFFQKLAAKAGITPNGLEDNETNNYQLIEAFLRYNNTIHTRRYEISMSRVFSSNESFDIMFPDVSINNQLSALYQPPTKISGVFGIIGGGYSLDGYATYGAEQIIANDSNVTVTLFSDRLRIKNNIAGTNHFAMQATIWIATASSSDFHNDGVKIN